MKQVKFLRGAYAGAVAFAVLSSGAMAQSVSTFPFDAPPDGLPGECFARVLVPAQYETVREQIMIDAGGSRLQVTPPEFAGQRQQYVVREAGVRYEVRQPVYRAVTEQVLVRPGHQVLQVIPGEFRNVTEQVQVSEPRLAWKPGSSLASKAGVRVTKTAQGNVYCLVEEPGEVQNISKRVQVRADQVRAIDVPPIYKTITRHVMVDPGGVREIPIAAQYGSYDMQQLVRPAGQISTAIEPRMGAFNRRVQISGESFRWVKVLCKTNATPTAISEVQSLLSKQGYYQGPVDGHIGHSTERAISNYQQEMRIPHGGFLSLQTIDSLRGGYQVAPQQRAPVSMPAVTSAPAYGWQPGSAAQYSYAGASAQASAHANVQRVQQVSGNWTPAAASGLPSYQDGQILSSIPADRAQGTLQNYEQGYSQSAPLNPAPRRRGGRRLHWYGKS